MSFGLQFYNINGCTSIFEKADIIDQYSLIREVFKHSLTYYEGQYRTPYINSAFAHNILKIKEKGPLFLEQPLTDFSENPMCTDSGKFFEHLYGFLMVSEQVLEKYNKKNKENNEGK